MVPVVAVVPVMLVTVMEVVVTVVPPHAPGELAQDPAVQYVSAAQ